MQTLRNHLLTLASGVGVIVAAIALRATLGAAALGGWWGVLLGLGIAVVLLALVWWVVDLTRWVLRSGLRIRSPFFRAVTVGSYAPEPTALPPGLPNVGKTYFNHEVVSLCTLAPVTDTAIRDRTFEDCTIRGPAIILATSPSPADASRFVDCEFQGFGRDVFIAVNPDTPVSAGIIRLAACTFRRCRFEGVSLIGTQEALEAMRNSPSSRER